MIIGDFTKKQPVRETYSVEFDPKDLNRGQRRAFARYVLHEVIWPEQRKLRKAQQIDLRGLWCPRCKLPFLSVRLGKAPVLRCQCKVARPRRIPVNDDSDATQI